MVGNPASFNVDRYLSMMQFDGYMVQMGWNSTTTLSPIIMEVENGVLEDHFSLQGGHFPLPWLWEEG